MNALRPNGLPHPLLDMPSRSSIRRNLPRKRAVVKAVIAALSERIGFEERTTFVWSLLSQLADDATPVLSTVDSFIPDLRRVIAHKDVNGYLSMGATYGSPTKYENAEQYFAAQVVLSLFKKASFWKADSLDPLRTAELRFQLAERYCRLANRRLAYYRKFDFNDSRPLPKRLRLHEVFHLARRKISSWLGSVAAVDFETGSRFGPGGTLSLSRPHSTAYFKLPRSGSNRDTVSTGAYFRAARIFINSRHSLEEAFASIGMNLPVDHPIDCIDLSTRLRVFDQVTDVADYNKVTFVPKNAKTHRSIAIEPDWNIQLQLAVGSYMKRQLKRAGIDLKDQSRNQELAREGSTDDGPHGPVTIDLEMASDTVCIELVRELLPPEWFDLLDGLRSRSGSYKGQVRTWNKFSSMGNGFTFELESMIFYALAQACSDLVGETGYFEDTYGYTNRYGFVSVFGDDIIVPKIVSPLLIDVLRFCGFRTNTEKTFVSGPFRESCGSDFWCGVPVRSRYYDGDIGRMKDLVQIRNLMVSNAEHSLGGWIGGSLIICELSCPQVVRDHLRSPFPTLGFDALYYPVDLCHSSFLVTFNREYQSFTYPSVSYTSRPWRTRQDRLYRATLYEISLRGEIEEMARGVDRKVVELPSKELRVTFRSY